MLPINLNSLDYVATFVFALDVRSDGMPVYATMNANARSYADFSLDDVLGKTAAELYPGPGGEMALEKHLNVIATRQPDIYEVELPLKGSLRSIRTTLIPVFDDDGEVTSLIGTSTDITFEKQGMVAQETVQTITSEVEDFVSMAAHDLRTPMRNVQHIADMLRDEISADDSTKLELIDLLEDVALKATGLISDVLSHAQATRVKGEVKSFDFKELTTEVYTVLDPLGNHQIKCDDAIIYGNKIAFQIVLNNLLDNAFKHGGKDALSLSISIRAVRLGQVEVTVEDDGRGFENPGIAFLSTGKMRVESGFGLLGIRRLIRSRGGDIFAEVPEGGVGSKIRFTLPGQLKTQEECNPQERKLA